MTGVDTVALQKVSTGDLDLGEKGPFASKYLSICLLAHFSNFIFYFYFAYSKHGCDYKGYGFACKLPRLDLTDFTRETIDKRTRPVLQSYCSHCHQKESWEGNTLVFCDGCPKAYHQHCFHNAELSNDFIKSDQPWYCSADCNDNLKKKRVIVELPRKRLPLMRTPKNALAEAATKSVTMTH